MKSRDEKQLITLIGKKTWKTLPEKAQEKLIKEYELIYSKETAKVSDVINIIRRQRRDQGLILVGALLGIFGGLFTNAIDRMYAADFGLSYNLIAIGLFFFFILIILRFFNKDIGDVIKENQLLVTMMKPPRRKSMRQLKVQEIKS